MNQDETKKLGPKKRKQGDGDGKSPEVKSEDEELSLGEEGEDSLSGGDEDDEEGFRDSEEEDEEMSEEFNSSYLKGFVPVVVKQDEAGGSSSDGFELAGQRDARAFMQWLVAPYPLYEFMEEVWQRRPLVVKREETRPAYYDGWFSTNEVDRLLGEVGMKYQYNVDVTSYRGKRQTWNSNRDRSTGIADPETVWERYKSEGCSIRVLHPQRWCDPLWKMLAALERFWNCSVGCNSYLTPPNSQGFSPHWDDIDAFVLQLEGRKCWKLYRPRSLQEVLPRFSSKNFEQDEIGEPILEVELGPGDLLYMPRGLIHQAVSPPGYHSLHLTVSTNQHNTWADLLEAALPRALELAASENCELRMAPPNDYMSYMGVVHSDVEEDPRRQAFQLKMVELASSIVNNLPMDAVADQMAKGLCKQRLPPPPLANTGGTGASRSSKKVSGTSRVKLAYPSCARLCIEEESAMVYHIMDNPRFMHTEGEEGDGDTAEEGGEQRGGVAWKKGVIQFSLDHACALESILLLEDEESLLVGSLPLESETECIDMVQRLVDAGITVLS